MASSRSWLILLLLAINILCSYSKIDETTLPHITTCYEIYDENHYLSCQEPRRKDKIRCLEPVDVETKKKYAISTPRNEMILFDDPYDNDAECVQIYKNDTGFKEICSMLEPYGISVTTPDNYTIWLKASKCHEGLSRREMRKDGEFIANFQFDHNERSCYHIYEEHDKISPYTCENANIFRSCEIVENNCSIIKTQRNDTITLACSNVTFNNNCVSVVYKGIKSEMCLEKLEERCVGFVTPSGLRILVACRYCYSNFFLLYAYNNEYWKKVRRYVKSYLEDEYRGKHSYLMKMLNTYPDRQWYSRHSEDIYGCWTPNKKCFAYSLINTRETIYIHCINETNNKPGCYTVVDEENNQENLVCSSVINENCVGLVTPKNAIVMLECYEDFLMQMEIDKFLKKTFLEFKSGIYRLNKFINMKKNHINGHLCSTSFEYKETAKLTNKNNITTIITPDDEKLVLINGTKSADDNICVDLHFLNNSDKNVSVIVCLQIVNNRCLGFITPNDWIIALTCYYPPITSGGASGVFDVKSKEPIKDY